jgi:hypothetical protein
MTVAQSFGPQGADHLAVASVATFPEIDIPASHLKRRVGLQTRHRFGGGTLEKKGDDFNQTANGDGTKDQDNQQPSVGFDFFVRESGGGGAWVGMRHDEDPF